MNVVVEKIRLALRTRRESSLSELVRKIGRSAVALAKARVFLSGCSEVGPRARTFGKRPDIRNRGTLRIGTDFTTSCAFGTVRLSVSRGGALVIGDGVSVNYGTALSATSSVRIGNRTKIGPYCIIEDSEMSMPDPRGGDPPRSITIGQDVWLGGRVTVLPGAQIGDGTVIAAGSVVSGSIPANAVASGNPARVLRVADRPLTAAPEPRASANRAERVPPHHEATDVDDAHLR